MARDSGCLSCGGPLRAHKDPRVARVLAQHGAKPVYLPPYSPQFNPIELAWSILKEFLRGAKARDVTTLNNCIALGMTLITPEIAAGQFRHCGYGAQPT